MKLQWQTCDANNAHCRHLKNARTRILIPFRNWRSFGASRGASKHLYLQLKIELNCKASSSKSHEKEEGFLRARERAAKVLSYDSCFVTKCPLSQSFRKKCLPFHCRYAFSAKMC
jgi:hypothetical protein